MQFDARDDRCRRINYEENTKLRKSVLNRLWDSLPPETQILSYSDNDDSDSDATKSGLEQIDDEEKENVDRVWKVSSKKYPTSATVLKNWIPEENESIDSNNHERTPRCSQTRPIIRPDSQEDPTTSWKINFNFVQSIIWLKSTINKLHRVPADEFLKAFKNQWELSPNITASRQFRKNTKKPKKSIETPLPRQINNPTNKQLDFLIKTKQRDKVDLINNRLASYDNLALNQRDLIVIPETDESEPTSRESSQCLPADQPATNVTRVLESMGTMHSTIDSGFHSEKPESSETISSENQQINIDSKKIKSRGNSRSLNSSSRVNDRLKSFGGNRSQRFFRSEGSSSRINPFHRMFHGNDGEDRKKIGERMEKRKHAGASKTMNSKEPRLSISSATLNYVLRSSECNQSLVVSVRAILRVLENEKDVSTLRIKWHGSMQQEAIEAIVNVVDLLDKEKGSNLCRNEVVAMVKRVLEKMLHSNEVDKLTVWEHHRLLIFEFCNALPICTEVVNCLISELKKLIPVVTQTTVANMRKSIDVMDKSYIIFHSLKIVLTKYRSFARTPTTIVEENDSERIPEVTELWKSHWKVNNNEPDIFVTNLEKPESPEDQKESWTRVLEELAVASTTIWPPVKVLAWQSLILLKSPVSSTVSNG